MKYEDKNPGEWQVDPKTGKRYRMPAKPTCRLPQAQERGSGTVQGWHKLKQIMSVNKTPYKERT